MKPRSFGTHDGTRFHADEVTACALLIFSNLIDQDKCIRSRDIALLEECEYVCDVGGVYDPSNKRFDHHQNDYHGAFSSAGMVLSHLQEKKIISQGLYEFLYQSLVWGVDAQDTGAISVDNRLATFSSVIATYVPAVEKNEDGLACNNAFHEAVDFTKNHLQRLVKRYEVQERYRAMVAHAMKERSSVLLFEESLPWMHLFFDLGGEEHPALFIMMPTSEGSWKLRGIPPSPQQQMGLRKPLPQQWRGLSAQALANASGIEGAIFCHKNGFLSLWKTRADAQKALEISLLE